MQINNNLQGLTSNGHKVEISHTIETKWYKQSFSDQKSSCTKRMFVDVLRMDKCRVLCEIDKNGSFMADNHKKEFGYILPNLPKDATIKDIVKIGWHSLANFADEINVTPQTITNWLSQDKRKFLQYIELISDKTNVPFADIVNSVK